LTIRSCSNSRIAYIAPGTDARGCERLVEFGRLQSGEMPVNTTLNQKAEGEIHETIIVTVQCSVPIV
ncbi:MAG: hypothetical protein QOJ41_3043, partial [Acidobacteriaceae bacterium]|nr:hypothetical protein [Acidobacteriaceae bacterium]